MSSKKSNSLVYNSSFCLRFVYSFGIVISKGHHQLKLRPLMRKFLALLIFSVFSLFAFSQTDSTKKDTTRKWKTGGMIAITVNQGGSRNWAAGSEKWSLSLGTILNVFANKQMGKWSWNNSLDMAYAFLNTESDGYTKTDDKIYFVSKFGRELKPKLNLTILLNYRSQFYDGYEKDYLGQEGLKRRTSGFMAPAYVTLAPGLDWKPTKSLSIFFTPVSVRWIIVSNKPFDYLYQGE